MLQLFTFAFMISSLSDISHPTVVNVVGSLDFVFAIRTANDLQPNGRNDIELGTPCFGHIVTMIVPLQLY